MEGHTAYIYMLSVYPFQMELFSFSLYTKHTLLNGVILFVKYGKGRECSSNGQSSLPARTLARRESTYQLTHQVSSKGQLPVSVCCRGGMICQFI